MTKFSKPNYKQGPQFAGFQGDVERAISSLTGQVTAGATYEDVDGAFVPPGPTTVAEAVARIAAAVAAGGGPIP